MRKRCACVIFPVKERRTVRVKIIIHVEEGLEDTTIAVSCGSLTPEIEKLLAAIRMLDRQLTVRREKETYFLDIAKIFYIESVDRKTFVYTGHEVYESDFRLYELEAQLEESGFLRANKSCLIQLKHIKSLKADIDRRIRVTMENGEQIIVSRQYAEGLKRRLGVK